MTRKLLIISASLNPRSRSRILAQTARTQLNAMSEDVDVDWLDLRNVDLPLCDGHANARLDPSYARRVSEAEGIIVAAPVYNYDLNAAIKAFLEMTGRAWTEKPVGFLLAAGGTGSYMSVMPFANSLMLDFRCLILPRFVYTVGEDYVDDAPVEEVVSRTETLCGEMLGLAQALQNMRESTRTVSH